MPAKPADEMPAPRTRRNRGDELYQAALTIFAEKGYDATSMQDVADAVGVLKGSLYHYVNSKEDLLFHLFSQAHERSERLMDEVAESDRNPVEKLRYYLQRLIFSSLDDADFTRLYWRDWRSLTGERLNRLVEQRRQYDLYLRRLIADAYVSLGLKPSTNLRYISSFATGGANWVADWYRKDGADSAEKIAEAYTELAMGAILAGAQADPSSNN